MRSTATNSAVSPRQEERTTIGKPGMSAPSPTARWSSNWNRRRSQPKANVPGPSCLRVLPLYACLSTRVTQGGRAARRANLTAIIRPLRERMGIYGNQHPRNRDPGVNRFRRCGGRRLAAEWRPGTRSERAASVDFGGQFRPFSGKSGPKRAVVSRGVTRRCGIRGQRRPRCPWDGAGPGKFGACPLRAADRVPQE